MVSCQTSEIFFNNFEYGDNASLKYTLVPLHVIDKIIELSDIILNICEVPAFLYLDDDFLHLSQ